MKKCKKINDFSIFIKEKMNLRWKRYNKSIFILFAYNSTGKTLISALINNDNNLCYNSFFEDLLLWNNKNELKFNYENFSSEVLCFMGDQGLGEQISDLFHEFISNDIVVDINFQTGIIYFYKSDDIDPETGENFRTKIKISRAEETLFKFSMFYVLLDNALLDIEENNQDSIFKNCEYVIVDDPTSNLDDSNIIRIANKIVKLYDNYKYKHKVKFLIETHNILFLDILKNNLVKQRTGKEKRYINFYNLIKNNNGYSYSNISSIQMAHHLDIKLRLETLLNNEFVSKSSYNLFRILLEKQASYMGFMSFSKCIRVANKTDKEDLIRCLNHYSHGNLTEIEIDYMDKQSADILKEAYNNFIDDYGWRRKND